LLKIFIMDIHTTIRQLRKQQNITQASMAEQLCVARSTYSKLESGVTAMPVATLIRIADRLQVSVNDLLQEDGRPFIRTMEDKFTFMLYQTEYVLSWERLSAIPYEELSFSQLAFLSKKGLASPEAYAGTPLKGRYYSYGPRDVFAHMMQQFGMRFLFEEKLIQDPYWLAMWKAFQTAPLDEEAELAASLDEYDYFTVHILDLTMPNGSTRGVQIAARDFPEDVDGEALLQRAIEKLGAVSGEILAYTEEGYDPVSEIITPN
jgi:transcriptional regulator with XRE-family HTH domain